MYINPLYSGLSPILYPIFSQTRTSFVNGNFAALVHPWAEAVSHWRKDFPSMRFEDKGRLSFELVFFSPAGTVPPLTVNDASMNGEFLNQSRVLPKSSRMIKTEAARYGWRLIQKKYKENIVPSARKNRHAGPLRIKGEKKREEKNERRTDRRRKIASPPENSGNLTDDGARGTTFGRPGLDAMPDEIPHESAVSRVRTRRSYSRSSVRPARAISPNPIRWSFSRYERCRIG